MQKYLIGVLSCVNTLARRNLCRRTWLPRAKAAGMDVVFVLKSPWSDDGQTMRLGDRLYLPVPDDYPSLPQKTRAFCQWALTIPDWTAVFKCDDDTYVAAARLAEYDMHGADYVGAEWRPGARYGSGGAGYFLSRRAVEIVAERLVQPIGAEDKLASFALRTAGVGIQLTIDDRFVPFGSEDRRPKPDNDLITAHAVGADLWAKIHDELYS